MRNPCLREGLLVVGITGTMGCGKSTVTRLLAERGARLLDADQMARAVVEPGQPGWLEVVARFGEEILVEAASRGEGEGAIQPRFRPLDRRKLAASVFADPEKKRALEAIIHPRIEAMQQATLETWAAGLASGERAIVAMEIPLLFEIGVEHWCDLTLAVVCGPQQWSRLAARAGMDEATKKAAIAQQLPEEVKRGRADRVIDNSQSLEATRVQVDQLWQELETMGFGHNPL